MFIESPVEGFPKNGDQRLLQTCRRLLVKHSMLSVRAPPSGQKRRWLSKEHILQIASLTSNPVEMRLRCTRCKTFRASIRRFANRPKYIESTLFLSAPTLRYQD
jgi:hypothetical protein